MATRAARVVRPLLLVVLLAGAVLVSRATEHLDSAKTAVWSEAMPGPVYLPPAWLARALSVGHPTLAADYFWMGALQYYGRPLNVLVYYKDLHRYIDLVNALDPQFRYAYQFGGVAIPWNKGHWTWMNVPESNAILTRGLARFPDDWLMWMQLGFNKGVLGQDYEGAADAYRHGAAAPHSPPWLSALVTRLLASSGSLDAARTYARAVMSRTHDSRLKASMQHRLLELDSEANRRVIENAMDGYRKQFGAPPKSLSDLVKAGLLASVPKDPLGGTYEIFHGHAYATSLRKGKLSIFQAEK